jgi:hypothetical protein
MTMVPLYRQSCKLDWCQPEHSQLMCSQYHLKKRLSLRLLFRKLALAFLCSSKALICGSTLPVVAAAQSLDGCNDSSTKSWHA